MGRLAAFSSAAAREMSAGSGAGGGAGRPGCGGLSNTAWSTGAICTFLGMSTSTGPGRPDAAMRKAAGMTSASSSTERTRKLCLVTGMDMP